MRSAHAVVLCALALSVTVAAIPMRVDIENVPVDRVVANLERDVAAEPKNAGLRVNLARVHAIAYAQKLSAVPSGSYPGGKTPPRVPWTGYFIPDFQQFDVKPATEPAAISAARDHLAKAIARYREALEIEPTNLVARIGLGWTLSESGDKAGAIAALARRRRALDAARSQADERDDGDSIAHRGGDQVPRPAARPRERPRGNRQAAGNGGRARQAASADYAGCDSAPGWPLGDGHHRRGRIGRVRSRWQRAAAAVALDSAERGVARVRSARDRQHHVGIATVRERHLLVVLGERLRRASLARRQRRWRDRRCRARRASRSGTTATAMAEAIAAKSGRPPSGASSRCRAVPSTIPGILTRSRIPRAA